MLFRSPACANPSSISLEEESVPELHMLCGENAYYTVKEKTIDFGRLKEFLAKKELLVNANRLFLHFKWKNRPVSIFKNGKIVMYDLPTSAIAQKQFKSLNTLMKEDIS